MVVAIVIPDYETQKQKVIRKDFSAAFDCLVLAKEWAESVLDFHKVPHKTLHFCCESTATYHFPLLHAWGGDPTVVNPMHVKLGAKKTDRVDARVLGEGDLTGRWNKSFQYPLAYQVPRILLRRRNKTLKMASAHSMNITGLLCEFGYTFQIVGSPYDSRVRPVVEDMLDGKPPIDAVFKPLCSGIPIPAPIKEVIRRNYASYDFFKERSKQYYGEARAETLRLDYEGAEGEVIPGQELYKLLQTIPGVGEVGALVMMSEIVSLARFPSVKAYLAWAGCDPTLRVSAGKVTAFITRKGNKILHRALVEGAQRVLQMDNAQPLAAWGQAYQAKQQKRGGSKAAQAVARRMAEGVYWVWAKRTPWRWHHGREKERGSTEQSPPDPGTHCSGDSAKANTKDRRGRQD